MFDLLYVKEISICITFYVRLYNLTLQPFNFD